MLFEEYSQDEIIVCANNFKICVSNLAVISHIVYTLSAHLLTVSNSIMIIQ